MRDVNHVQNRIADYVLGLLPYSERKEVERHAAACLDCRLALQRQKQIGRLVRETVQVAAAPAPDQLRRLMPAAPRRPAVPFLSHPWQRQLAALCVALILLVSSAGLYSSNHYGWRNSVPSFITVTATTTRQPTVTLARLEATGSVAPTETAVLATPSPAIETAGPSPTATLTKAPTPIAALFSLSN